MTSRRQPSAAFWATVVALGVLAYPLSFGPACWILSRVDAPERVRDMHSDFYYPITRSAMDGPSWLQGPLIWWIELCQAIPDHRRVTSRDIVAMAENGVSDAVIC